MTATMEVQNFLIGYNWATYEPIWLKFKPFA